MHFSFQELIRNAQTVIQTGGSIIHNYLGGGANYTA